MNKNAKKAIIVLNIKTNSKYEFESRFEAAKFTGIERKALNAYIDKGITYKKTFKFLNA
jgi:hypothetical protein